MSPSHFLFQIGPVQSKFHEPIFANRSIQSTHESFNMANIFANIRFDLYASVMGITGLGLAWRFAENLFSWPCQVDDIFIVTGFIIFIALTGLNLIRIVVYPALIISEWKNNAQFNFFPALTISGSLLSIGILPYSKTFAEMIWWPTVILQVLLIVLAVRRLKTEKIELNQISAVWLIPMVGNASPCFAGVPLGYASFSFALLMTSITCWILFTPIILWRLIMTEVDNKSAMPPSIAILVSAPAVISVGLYGYPQFGKSLFFLLSYSALFFGLIVISVFNRFKLNPFHRGLWAFTFPASALASSLLRLYELNQDPYHYYQAIFGLGLATLTVFSIMVHFLCSFRHLKIKA